MVTPEALQSEPISDPSRWASLQRRLQERNAAKAFAIFREHGVEPILIKGLAAAVNYPSTVFRSSVDMDLAVAAKDFPAAQKLLLGLDKDGLAIDLHRELRHLDTLEWTELFQRSVVIETADGTYRALCPEDHLRILCVHWLTDGGSNRDRLWDIYYAIENRPENFDWDRFLNTVSPKRRRWLICTIGLAHKYLGLDLADTPIEAEARDLPPWLIKTVEQEWQKTEHDRPLETVLEDKGMLLQQIRSRFKPNPIWATVQMEGGFDARTRVFYQLGLFFYRIPSSIRRVAGEIRHRNT